MTYLADSWIPYTPLFSSVNHAQILTTTSGAITLSYGGFTTASIGGGSTPASVQTKLNALTSIGASGVVCTGGNTNSSTPISISWQGSGGALFATEKSPGIAIASGTGATISSEPAIGDGSVTGAYRLRGKAIDIQISMKFGSTSTYGTVAGYAWSLPTNLFTALSNVSQLHEYHGSGYIGGGLKHWIITPIIHGLANVGNNTDRPEIRAICHTSEYPAISITNLNRVVANSVSTASCVVPAGHNFRAGDQIVIASAATSFNGTFCIEEHSATGMNWAQAGVTEANNATGTAKRVPTFGLSELTGSAQPVGWFGVHSVPDDDAFSNGSYWSLQVSFAIA